MQFKSLSTLHVMKIEIFLQFYNHLRIKLQIDHKLTE